MANWFFKVPLGREERFNHLYFSENVRTPYLVERFGVSPVVTLGILKNAGGTNLDTVAGQLVSQGLHCLVALLDRQQGKRSGHRGKKQTF